MEFIRAFELSKSQKHEISQLWNREYPKKLCYNSLEDFEDYLSHLSGKSYVLLLNEDRMIIGWYMDFVRYGEKWFVIILDSKYQGNRFGTKLLNMAKIKEPILNGWVIDHDNDVKVNGEFYKSPLDFYLKNGFELLSDIRLELDKISAVKITWNKSNTIK